MREILFRGVIKKTGKYQGQRLNEYYAVDDGKPIIAIPEKTVLKLRRNKCENKLYI